MGKFFFSKKVTPPLVKDLKLKLRWLEFNLILLGVRTQLVLLANL